MTLLYTLPQTHYRCTTGILITIKLCNMVGPFPYDPNLDVSTTCSMVHRLFLTTCSITYCNFVSEHRYNLGFTSQVTLQSIHHCKQVGGNCFITTCNHRSCIFCRCHYIKGAERRTLSLPICLVYETGPVAITALLSRCKDDLYGVRSWENQAVTEFAINRYWRDYLGFQSWV